MKSCYLKSCFTFVEHDFFFEKKCVQDKFGGKRMK